MVTRGTGFSIELAGLILHSLQCGDLIAKKTGIYSERQAPFGMVHYTKLKSKRKNRLEAI